MNNSPGSKPKAPSPESPVPDSRPLAGLRAGFVGAGRIGAPMVERLAAAGAHVTVFARREEVRRGLSAAGARTAGQLADIAPGSAVVISCLYSDDQLAEVADAIIPRLEPGAVLISHTTGSPAVVRDLAPMVRERGADIADAAFSGNADDVRAGRLTVLLGGQDNAAARAEPFVRAYAQTVIRTGGLGTALVLKLLNNLLFAANVQLSLEAARVAQELGLGLAELDAVLRCSSGGSTAMRYLAAAGDPAAYASQVRPYMVKDVDLCETVAASVGADLGLLGTVARHGPLWDTA